MKTSFERLDESTDEELAAAGWLRVSQYQYLRLASIRGFEAASETGLLYLKTGEGNPVQVPTSQGERILSLLLGAGISQAERETVG